MSAIVTSATYRDWHLYCAHVRTNHVHVVVQPDVDVNRALAYLKARATFVLKSIHPGRIRFWSKHGSTRYLWDRPSLDAAVDYVLNQQGERMAVWERG